MQVLHMLAKMVMWLQSKKLKTDGDRVIECDVKKLL